MRSFDFEFVKSNFEMISTFIRTKKFKCLRREGTAKGGVEVVLRAVISAIPWDSREIAS